jgi:hypothetical protein
VDCIRLRPLAYSDISLAYQIANWGWNQLPNVTVKKREIRICERQSKPRLLEGNKSRMNNGIHNWDASMEGAGWAKGSKFPKKYEMKKQGSREAKVSPSGALHSISEI